jgi:hypothetical protein
MPAGNFGRSKANKAGFIQIEFNNVTKIQLINPA